MWTFINSEKTLKTVGNNTGLNLASFLKMFLKKMEAIKAFKKSPGRKF